MTIRFVFADVDLTMMGRDHVFTRENIDAITKVRQMGIHFYIQTGRLPCALREVLDPLGINHRDDEFMICGNGAIICDTDLKFYTDHYMPSAIVDKLIDRFENIEGCVYALVSAEKYYVSGDLLSLNRNTSKVLEKASYEEMKALITKTKFYKFLLQHQDPATLSDVADSVKEMSGGKATAVFSAADNLEVIPSDISKGLAMKEFCEIMKTDPAEILAIGDNHNDESMIDLAGYKACPSNAVDELKAKCDYVSPYDCYNSAVADILDKLIISRQ
ncbi:MAG: HAD family phosphatase [Erysipelotrichaceae bacterium]|nr:HAD family phosphatase [Erysipelotrichaceae bacterium]